MQDNTSKLLKEKLLELLSWFHHFCEKHGLRYYALGGTMLGAARHHGFIPWDDDIDVGMPRPEYERFRALMEKEAQARFLLETPENSGKDYFYPFFKLYDTTTTLVENTRYRLKRGVYLDIFPLDGFGRTEEEARETFARIKKAHNLLLCRVAGWRKGRKLHKNLAAKFMQLLPFINNKKLLLQLCDKCKEKDYAACTWVGNPVGAWGMREIMPVEVMGEPTLCTFEDLQIYGVADPDAYLTRLYGNWKQPPPPEKQVTHHDFICLDLNKSYLED